MGGIACEIQKTLWQVQSVVITFVQIDRWGKSLAATKHRNAENNDFGGQQQRRRRRGQAAATVLTSVFTERKDMDRHNQVMNWIKCSKSIKMNGTTVLHWHRTKPNQTKKQYQKPWNLYVVTGHVICLCDFARVSRDVLTCSQSNGIFLGL